MKQIKLMFILVALVAFASSCQEEYEAEMIPGHELAGEWYVTYTIGGVDVYNFGYSTIMTNNTAAADGKQIWVSDLGHFWDYKAKVNADPANASFGQTDSLDNAEELGYPIKLIVKSGKVFTDGGKSKTGVVTDSISFVIGFGDDAPGTEYTASGHRRTGFVEDDF
jgi:hypothetical protein